MWVGQLPETQRLTEQPWLGLSALGLFLSPPRRLPEHLLANLIRVGWRLRAGPGLRRRGQAGQVLRQDQQHFPDPAGRLSYRELARRRWPTSRCAVESGCQSGQCRGRD
jgi:hypothetical protein